MWDYLAKGSSLHSELREDPGQQEGFPPGFFQVFTSTKDERGE